ncbi:MAG: 3-dehydroquinate synthase [Burkholderiales bacterium]
MRTLKVKLTERSYPIHIGNGLLSQAKLITECFKQRRGVVITNKTVAPLYLGQLVTSLSEQGVETVPITIPDGEAYKNSQTLNSIFDALVENRCERGTPIIALGGGVVGDIAGFAAAVYQRGVPFLQIPTTLLAQVDSSVGGKTAINHPYGKNMIGAFYQPRAVIADTDTLQTLPQRELVAGLAEVIKYGLIRDYAFLSWIEANVERLLARDPDALAYAIEQSCRTKAEVVELDELEHGLRAHLNFGHTFGHAIEAGTGYGTWLHGEAVAAGMLLAAQLSQRMGYLTTSDVARISTLLSRVGLPLDAPDLGPARYLELMAHDKKVEGGKLQLIMLEKLGTAFVSEAPGAALHGVLEQLTVHA